MAIVAKSAQLFMERGYEATSVNELANALDISIGGLYRYIDTKADLLTLVCDDIYGRLPDRLRELAAADGTPAERLLRVAAAYLRACATNRRLILLMYREYRHLPPEAQTRYEDREEQIVATLRDLLAACQASATGDRDTWDPYVVARDIVLLGHLPALKGWALRRRRVAADTLLREQLSVIAAMIGAPPPARTAPGSAAELGPDALEWSGVGLARRADAS